MLHSINWPNFIVLLSFLLEILCSMCITIVCSPDCDVIKFEINLSFSSRRFDTWPKTQDKKLIAWERKNLLRWNKKHFSLFLKDFQSPKCPRPGSAPLRRLLKVAVFFSKCGNEKLNDYNILFVDRMIISAKIICI